MSVWSRASVVDADRRASSPAAPSGGRPPKVVDGDHARYPQRWAVSISSRSFNAPSITSSFGWCRTVHGMSAWPIGCAASFARNARRRFRWMLRNTSLSSAPLGQAPRSRHRDAPAEPACLKMGDDLLAAWNDIASGWAIGDRPTARPPRHRHHPSKRSLAGAGRRRARGAGLSLRCHPEIATMSWPCAVELLAMDRVESMVRAVWPGDVPGVRGAIVGDWLNSGVPPGSRDIVVGDGGFGFFDYPAASAVWRRRCARCCSRMDCSYTATMRSRTAASRCPRC